jgi:hypothetical protein
MVDDIPLTLQSAYSDLLDRAASAAFGDAFTEEGGFVAKTLRGRRYWYFQVATDGGRQQKYVGPETPELLERIERHKAGRGDDRDRRALVSALVRSAQLPRPPLAIADVVAALAKAGVFRLRAVLVGTVAFHTYAAMLSARLGAPIQTGDVDVAQFSDVSVAVGDQTPAILDVLREVDRSFRSIPHPHDSRRVTTYEAAGGLRVDFLTPNKGPDSDAPKALPALGTDAQQLRFLDFLIHEPEPAVVLRGAGIYVMVPSPQRYAVHKLIVARRRRESGAKRDKDLRQVEALLDVLIRKRPHELRAVWEEAMGRGKTWRQLLGEGIGLIRPEIRERTLKTVGSPRSIVPGLDLEFAAPAARYDFDRDVVTFLGFAAGATIRCAISREALDDHFGADGLDKEARLRVFRENRNAIEVLARRKFLESPIEERGTVLIKTNDVEALRPRTRSTRAHR